jgi:hypothetical protein
MNGCGIQIFVSTAKVAVCFFGLVVLFSQVLQNIYCVGGGFLNLVLLFLLAWFSAGVLFPLFLYYL